MEKEGTIAALWRYPVKSMQGEELDAAKVTEAGILGDRGYAVLDRATGQIASTKHPRLWASLITCRARYLEPPTVDAPLPPVAITFPDGTGVRSDDPYCELRLSHLLGREVALVRGGGETRTREADRTPLDATDAQPLIQAEPLALAAPTGSLVDVAPLHLLTTATLASLQDAAPDSRIDARRFRPNLVVTTRTDESAFPELDWLGCTLRAGASVQLRVIDPSPRCVVTTLAQGELPRDPHVLRALAERTRARSLTLAPGMLFSGVAGVYAAVVTAGTLTVRDALHIS
jgi:uncharacterized protein